MPQNRARDKTGSTMTYEWGGGLVRGTVSDPDSCSWWGEAAATWSSFTITAITPRLILILGVTGRGSELLVELVRGVTAPASPLGLLFTVYCQNK